MKFKVPMEPTAKGRARVTKKGFSYTPKKTESAEQMIRSFFTDLKDTERFSRDVPLVLTVDFFLSRPKSAPKKRIYPTTRPDFDNYVKLVCDALEKFAYVDDAQFVDAHIYKRYTDFAPSVVIEITEAKW